MSCWTFMWVVVQKKYVEKKKKEEIESGAWDARLEAKMKATAYTRLSYDQRYQQYEMAQQRVASGQAPHQMTIDEVEEHLGINGASTTQAPLNSRSATPISSQRSTVNGSSVGTNFAVIHPELGRGVAGTSKSYKVPNLTTGIVTAKDVEMRIHSNKTGYVTYSGMTTDIKEYPRIQFIIHFKGMTAPYDRVCSQIMGKQGAFNKQRVDFDMSFDPVRLTDLQECIIEVRHYKDDEGRYGEAWGDYLTTDQDASKREEREFAAKYEAKKRAMQQQRAPQQGTIAQPQQPVAYVK